MFFNKFVCLKTNIYYDDKRKIHFIAASGLFLLTLNVSCGKGRPKSGCGTAATKPQPYQFITVEQGPATVYEEFPARLQGNKISKYVRKLTDL